MNGKAATLLALVYGLLFAALATRRGEVAWMAAPLLTTLAFSLLRAPGREIRLAARRRVERDDRGRIEVTVTVQNGGAEALHLRLGDTLRPATAVERGATATRTLLEPGEEAEISYAFRAPRGRFAWDAVHAVAADPLGLVEERLELPAPGEMRVLPEVARFRALPLRPSRTLPSPGSIPARVGGSGTDFFGIREYQVGDALRWIDWRHTARHPGKLFTREFEQEQIADVGLVLDGRGTVGDPGGGPDLFEHAVRATASLAATCLRQGDRVSLLVLGEADARVFPGAGRVQLQRVLSCLARVRAATTPPMHDARHSFLRLFPARSIVFVLTPLLFDDMPLLLRLKAHDHQVVVVSPDPIGFRAASPRNEVERLALRAARVERRLTLRAISRLRMPVVDWRVDRPLHPLVRSALRPVRGGRRP